MSAYSTDARRMRIAAMAACGAIAGACLLCAGAAPAQAAAVKAGGGQTAATYKVSGSMAVYAKARTSGKTAKVPASIKTSGKTYAVKGIAKGAFKGTKVTKVLIASAMLTKKSVKGSLKGSKVKKIRAPYSMAKKYKKTFAKKNSGKSVKVYMRYQDKYLRIDFPSRWVGKTKLVKTQSAYGYRLYEWYFNNRQNLSRSMPEVEALLTDHGGDAGPGYRTKSLNVSSYYRYAAVAHLVSWSKASSDVRAGYTKKTWRHGATNGEISYIVKSVKFY